LIVFEYVLQESRRQSSHTGQFLYFRMLPSRRISEVSNFSGKKEKGWLFLAVFFRFFSEI